MKDPVKMYKQCFMLEESIFSSFLLLLQSKISLKKLLLGNRRSPRTAEGSTVVVGLLQDWLISKHCLPFEWQDPIPWVYLLLNFFVGTHPQPSMDYLTAHSSAPWLSMRIVLTKLGILWYPSCNCWHWMVHQGFGTENRICFSIYLSTLNLPLVPRCIAASWFINKSNSSFSVQDTKHAIPHTTKR